MKVAGVTHIGIIGTGMIGASQAALFTGNGYKTTLYARSDESIARGRSRYEGFYDVLIEKKLVTRKQANRCAEYLHFTKDFADLADAEVIYECVPEEIEMKYEVYGLIEQHCSAVKAVASVTSAKAPDDLAKGFNLHKDKVMVAHPFYPPHLIPFVEIVKGEATTDEAVRLVYDLLESCGRKPIIANRALPGFVANRLQHALVREAAYLIDEGIVESAEHVDRALTYSFAPRYASVGLFEHQDAAGLDMVYRIQEYILPSLSRRTDVPDVIRKHYEKGELGMKTGSGMHQWTEEKKKQFHEKAAAPYFQFFNWDIPS